MSQLTLKLLFGVSGTSKPLRYRLKGGFPRAEDFLEIIGQEVWVQRKGGNRCQLQSYTPESCETLVANSIWERV